jgi:hypothetical protein
MLSAPRLYHASYQLDYRVLVQTQLSIVQFQELTGGDSLQEFSAWIVNSAPWRKDYQRRICNYVLIVILEDTRLCAIKLESVCYNCCV